MVLEQEQELAQLVLAQDKLSKKAAAIQNVQVGVHGVLGVAVVCRVMVLGLGLGLGHVLYRMHWPGPEVAQEIRVKVIILADQKIVLSIIVLMGLKLELCKFLLIYFFLKY